VRFAQAFFGPKRAYFKDHWRAQIYNTTVGGMEPSDIDSDSLQAVKSLRSKFEKLAQDASPQKLGPLTVTAPSSPRPRATSNSQLNPPLSDDIQLRPSSSSSDLRLPAKRAPPPPPPPRVSKLMNNPSPSRSPASSPLLRPVPVPPTEKVDSREQPPRNWNLLVNASPARSPSPFLLSRPVPIPSSNSPKAELEDHGLEITTSTQHRS